MNKLDSKNKRASAATIVGTFCCGLALAGDGNQPASQQASALADTQNETRDKPVYTPPRRGAPRTRVGGGTRGSDSSTVVLQVLAPEETGMTTAAQPILYWYASRAIDGDVEFVLTERDAVEPIWRQRITGAFPAGIQSLALQDAGFELQLGAEYQWSVAVVHPSGQRARDVVAIGTVERIAAIAPPSAGTGAADRAAMLASNGLWYDAIQVLNESIEHETDDNLYRSYRRDLLEQVGLLDVAYADAIASTY